MWLPENSKQILTTKPFEISIVQIDAPPTTFVEADI